MKQSFLGPSIAAILFAVVQAATPAGQSGAQKINGHLVDVICADDHAAERGYVKKHDKACNLSCVKSGYSLVTADHRVLKFDQNGNEQALSLLKATDREKNWKVAVTGTVNGDSIAVTSIAIAR